MTAINLTKSTTLSTNAYYANTFISRLIGLLNRRSLKEGEALIIPGCNNIHTFFMRFAIDIVFLKTQINTDVTQMNADNLRVSAFDLRKSALKVIKISPNLKPFRLSYCPGADSVLELPSGTIVKTKTQAQDMIYFNYD